MIFDYKAFDRYVYRITSRNKEWSYYDISKESWYIDLKSGILYNSKSPSVQFFPAAALTLSKLFIL